MKTIKFRPLRIIKKTGKITVASYMQWRKVVTADYSKFKLLINDEHKKLAKDEYVHNHKGEQLFWYNHKNPDELPKNYADIKSISKYFEIDEDYFSGEEYKLNEPLTKGFHWSVRGFDCDGVPTFSHYTTNYIATHYKDVTDFEPLTVEMVLRWYGWFLWQLDNSRLSIVK